jgi:hypothetical protein
MGSWICLTPSITALPLAITQKEKVKKSRLSVVVRIGFNPTLLLL